MNFAWGISRDMHFEINLTCLTLVFFKPIDTTKFHYSSTPFFRQRIERNQLLLTFHRATINPPGGACHLTGRVANTLGAIHSTLLGRWVKCEVGHLH